MRRVVVYTLVLMFVASIASASIVVNPIELRNGDTVKYNGQTYAGSTGNGGPFTWSFYSAAASPTPPRATPPAFGTLFYTFCTEINQYVPSSTIVVTNLTDAGSLIPSYFIDSKGLYAFEKWAENSTYHNSPLYSAATQVAVWQSRNFAVNSGGLTWSNYASEIAALTSGWTTSWVPTDQSVIIWTNNQDQIYISSAIPEPASIVVWSLIATVSCLGVTVWRRRARV
jgi:hypothetical protein